MKDAITIILSSMGGYYLVTTLACRFGIWSGLQWGGKYTDQPGWWKFRDLPQEREYRKIGRKP